MNTFVISLGPNSDQTELNKLMEILTDSYVEYIQQVANEFGVSSDCASDIVYLRGRSRWTKDLETQLIALWKEGTPPNIFEFGH